MSIPDPIHGELGVLRDDGEKAQCHVCGEWFLHLGVHTNAAHGLTAAAYRERFGLMQKTKLGGPAWLAMRSKVSAEHLRTVEAPRRQQVKTMTTEQRRAEQAKGDWHRREHELGKTEPERIRHALVAKYGTERGHPDAFIRDVAALFVEELHQGQRGVYKRLGERMGTDWSTARSRVMIAVKRGFLIWTGENLKPAGHLPGEEPFGPPDSFEARFAVLQRRVGQVGDARVPKAEEFQGEPLGIWAQTWRYGYRRGSLGPERARRLASLPGWVWTTR